MKHRRIGSVFTILLFGSLLSATTMATPEQRCESLFSPVTVSVVGLSESYGNNEKALAQSYIHYVAFRYGRIPMYSDLPLTQRLNELAISSEFKDRATVIVSTSSDRHVILGGVMVTQANPRQKLPFQNTEAFLAYQRPSDEGRVAEIGRLTVSDDNSSSNLNRGKNMVLLALKSIAQDPSITHVYVHTSAVHARLYRTMGFQPELIIKHDDLNYLIRYTRAELERHLR